MTSCVKLLTIIMPYLSPPVFFVLILPLEIYCDKVALFLEQIDINKNLF